jgi:stage V sporulation protein G
VPKGGWGVADPSKGDEVRITKVTLRPVAMNKVCAIASIVIDDCFVIHDLRVVNGDKGLFVAMPSRKLPNGDFRDICHPINTDARNAIQQAVLDQFATDGGVEAFAAAAAEELEVAEV